MLCDPHPHCWCPGPGARDDEPYEPGLVHVRGCRRRPARGFCFLEQESGRAWLLASLVKARRRHDCCSQGEGKWLSGTNLLLQWHDVAPEQHCYV